MAQTTRTMTHYSLPLNPSKRPPPPLSPRNPCHRQRKMPLGQRSQPLQSGTEATVHSEPMSLLVVLQCLVIAQRSQVWERMRRTICSLQLLRTHLRLKSVNSRSSQQLEQSMLCPPPLQDPGKKEEPKVEEKVPNPLFSDDDNDELDWLK